jgi:putative addiction module component (TIGR02574 family)
MNLADFPNVQALSAVEKLQLVDAIWASVGHDLSQAAVSELEKRLLDERWSAYEQNPGSALTLVELKDQVAAARR